jgi:GGDEF domain-containing protein
VTIGGSARLGSGQTLALYRVYRALGLGGGEFGAIMPSTDRPSLSAIAARIIEAIEDLSLSATRR